MKNFFAVFFSVTLLLSAITPASRAAEELTGPEGTFQLEFETLAEAAQLDNVQKVTNPANPGDMSTKYASGESFWGHTGTQTDPSATFTFTAPKAGYYEVYYALGNAGANTTDLSPVSLTVNDVLVGDNIKNNTQIEDLSQYQDNGDGTKKRIYPWQYMGMMLFKGSSVCYLNAGENSLKAEVIKSGGNMPAYKFFADYIKFVPTKGTIIASEGTIIEAENMTSQFPVEITGASGGKWIGKDAVTVAGEEATTELKPIQTLVTFPESRYYDLSFVTTKWSSSVSEISLHLGGNKIGGNKEDQQIGVNVQDRFTGTEGAANWTKQWCNMMEYSKSVWIEAGTYPLEIQVACCEHQDYTTVVKYFMDYVSFKPTADSVEKDDLNNYMAKVYFGAPVSGTAMIALYNGQELLGVSSKSVSEAQYVETSSVQTDKTVTKVKVFVWDGFENCVPQIACKEIIVSE